MKNLNKVLAMLVVFMMVVSTVAFASFSDVAETSSYSTAVEVDTDLGLIKGYEDGTFRPEGEITRAEFAAIVVRMLGQEGQVAGAATVTQFTDVPATDWSAGYVNIATQAGIIKGYGDGRFGPNDQVEYQDALTMMVRALGYEPAIGSAGYPTGYLTKAGDLGLTSNVSGSNGVAINRGAVAQIAFNALDVPLMTQSGYGTFTQYVINDGYSSTNGTTNVKKTILSENHKIVKVQGTIIDSTDTTATGTTGTDKVTVNVTNYLYNKFFGLGQKKMEVGDSDALKYVGKKCIIFVEYDEFEDKCIIKSLYEAPLSDSLTINLDDVDTFETVLDGTTVKNYKITYYVDDVKKSATISAGYDRFYNGVAAASTTVPSWTNLKKMSGTVQLALLDTTSTSADYDTMYIDAYDVFVVDEVKASASRVTAKNNPIVMSARITYDESNGENKATLVGTDGEAMDWKDLNEYDVLLVKYVKSSAKNIYDAKVINNTVTGSVDELSGDAGNKVAVIGDNEYDVNVSIEGDIKLGDEGIFYLDDKNTIVYVDTTSTVSDNYAFVIGVDQGTGFSADTYQIQLVTKDNAVIIYDVAKTIKVTAYFDATTGAPATTGTIAQYKTETGIKAKDVATFLASLKGKLITYRANSSDAITTIEVPYLQSDIDNEKFSLDVEAASKTAVTLTKYDPDDKSFRVSGKGTKYLDSKTVIFNVDYDTATGNPTDETEVVALSNLAKDDDLVGADVYDIDEDDVIGCIVLRGTNEFYGSSDNATFVTKVSESKDADGDNIIYIYGYRDGEAVTYTSEDLTKSDVKEGSLIIPKYSSNGALKSIKVCDATNSAANALGTDKNANSGVVTKVDGSHNIITIAGIGEVKVKSSANVYVYNERLNRTKYIVDESVGYIDFDDSTAADSWGLYIDESNKNLAGKVTAYLYYVDGEVADMVYYIAK
ncbi:MAG: S-layer homology domain-containing protein [Clostridia bacterium]|nr:S-layer homology domain-containing protein [Clostridia bacterium]